MKGISLITVFTFMWATLGCSNCVPDTQDWKLEQHKFKTIVELYAANKLVFGDGNKRVERIVPDSLRITHFDSISYANVGSRENLNDGTFSLRFYKLNSQQERISEIVFTTQTSDIKNLENSSCCLKLSRNWYLRKLD